MNRRWEAPTDYAPRIFANDDWWPELGADPDDEGLDAFMDLPLVAFFRRWQFRIGIACYAIAVVTACVFAFQMGRGL